VADIADIADIADLRFVVESGALGLACERIQSDRMTTEL